MSSSVDEPSDFEEESMFEYSSSASIKKQYETDFKGIILSDKLLDQFHLFPTGNIYTSNFSVYSGEKDIRLPDLMKLTKPFFAFGQPPGYGFNNYEFVIYYSDKERVFMLKIPYGGIYMDNVEGQKIINEAFQKLEKFISDSPKPAENAKVGFFFKNVLGFSPYFNVDKKTFDFTQIKE